MCKFVAAIFVFIMFLAPVSAKTDKYSESYLKDRMHISVANPLVEKVVKKAIVKSLKKELGGKYKVKFKGYTLASMKKGIFKHIEITGYNSKADGIEIPYLNLRTLSDYNWIDYNQNPVVAKSDITLEYIMHLNEDSINTAIHSEKYQKEIQKINQRIYPFFLVNDLDLKIKDDRVYITIDYVVPLSKRVRNKKFVVTSNFKVVGGKIKAYNIGLNKEFGHSQIEHITNLINLLDPLSFTLDFIEKDHCNGTVENVIIKDNIIEVMGKIFIKAQK